MDARTSLLIYKSVGAVRFGVTTVQERRHVRGCPFFGIISEEILSTDSYEVYQRPCRLVTAQHGD